MLLIYQRAKVHAYFTLESHPESMCQNAAALLMDDAAPPPFPKESPVSVLEQVRTPVKKHTRARTGGNEVGLDTRTCDWLPSCPL